MSERTLAAHHRHKLEIGSGITAGQIASRGYYTATTVSELVDLGFRDAQALAPALVIPSFGVDGDIVSYQIRPDSPRSRDGKVIKYESLPDRPPRLDIPPGSSTLAADPSVSAWITEGVLKGDSIYCRGHFPIALPGVWSWRGTNHVGGSLELADWDRIAIKGRVFFLAFDSDVVDKTAVRQALRRLAAVLKRRGARDVRPIRIPAGEGQKVGIDDFLAAGGSLAELIDNCVDLDLIRPTGIVVNNRPLPDITKDALDAVVAGNFPPSLFVRAGELARISTDERGIAKIESLSQAAVRGILARAAGWVRVNKDGVTEVSPPKDTVEDFMALGNWPEIPPVVAVTRAPVLASDGTLSTTPGYCARSRFYVATRDIVPEWEGTAAEAAAYIMHDVLADFPFTGDADRAHALALMLLPIVRPAIEGPTPLHLIDAPVQGTGKSLLAKICLMPTVGDQVGATTGTRDEEEWRKKIASSLLEGRAYVFFDNLSRKVDSDSLAGVLTSTEWNDRALSTMRNINVPVRCAWVATANNAELSRDILRRTVWIRLDANVERPEDRTEFRHPNIELWMKANRPKVVSALCAIVRAWVDAGMPEHQGRYLGSFEDWSKVLGGIFDVVGVNGYLGNIKELRERAGSEDTAWAEFYLRWYNHFQSQPVKAGQLLEEFELDESLAGMLGDKGESSRKTRLGHLIKRRVGVVADGYRIEPCSSRSGSGQYRLMPVSAIRTGGVLENSGGVLGEIGGVSDKPHQENQTQNGGLVGFGGVSNNPTHMRARTHTNEPASKPHKPHQQVQNGEQNPTTNPTTLDDDEEVI